MAGLRYQDKVERCGTQAAASPLSPDPLGVADEHADLLGTRQYPTQILDEHLPGLSAATIDSHTAAAAASAPASPAESMPDAEHQPMATQWAALRNLRDVTTFQHKRFEQLCRDLGDPTISKLLEIFPNAQSIRNKGAQLVKDVLEGFRPRELSLVFAFVSFAYAISQLLHRNGRIDKSEILADLKVWRSLISDPRERQAFDLIAQGLWPEARDHLHFIPVAAQQRVAQFPDLSPSRDVELTESVIADFLSSLEDGQGATDQHIGLFGTDHFGFNNAASHIGQEDVLNPEITVTCAGSLLKMSNGEFGFDRLQYAAGTSPNNEFFHQAPSRFGLARPNSADYPGSPFSRGGTPDVFGGGGDQLQPIMPLSTELKLEDTGIFLVVLVFLLDIAELGFILSGRSLSSRRHKLYKAEERDQEGFYKFAREAFFKPHHRQELQPPAFSALLYVAEKFTKGGLLRSIAEIEHYLVSVAAVSQALGPNSRHIVCPTESNAMIDNFPDGLSTRRSLEAIPAFCLG